MNGAPGGSVPRSAEETITEALQGKVSWPVAPKWAARVVLDALDAAGFAVVQLPEPNEFNEWGGTDWFVWISRGGSMQVRSPGYMSHPIKARQFAAALLAASLAVSGVQPKGEQ